MMLGTQFLPTLGHGLHAIAQCIALDQRQAKRHDCCERQHGGDRRDREVFFEENIEKSDVQAAHIARP
ncbi:MAG TPA: hypothetical protein VLC29_11490 [Rhizomicrobium sp.]|nr:hypothetical protein [Rhizomicrobium sp.]